jgi:hypothetical protein
MLLTLLGPQGAAPPATKTIWIKVSGVWKQATPFIKVSGVWKQSTPFIKISGIWK